MEEELQNSKLTNQMFVQAPKEDETTLNAATFISVVSVLFSCLTIVLIFVLKSKRFFQLILSSKCK